MLRCARIPLFLFALLALGWSADADAKRKKRKKRRKGEVPTGWVDSDDGQAACYYPPAWDSLNEIDRRMKRAESLDEVLNQWRGQRSDGVDFGEELVEEVEITLLGRPEKIESFIASNKDQCTKGNIGAWKGWAKGLKASLTSGECNQPLDYTMFDYLDIGSGWQRPLNICKGDRIAISGSASDKYRLSDDSPWITVAGDPDQPTSGSEWPCNLEGCLAGMLMMRFVGKGSGIESLMPVGVRATFSAPEDGVISYRINDTTFFDNKWHTSGSVIDHTSIEVSPAQ